MSARQVMASVAAAAALVAGSGAMAADAVEEFYKGKTITLIVSTGAGGGYDIYGRPLARHMSAHIPGKPTIVVQNMEGGGGLRATNFLYSAAPKDGTAIALVHSGVPFAPLLGIEGAKFEATKFSWIGSMNKEGAFCIVWHESAVKRFEDLQQHELIVGGTGAGSQMETYPLLLKNLFGARIKVISGYKAGNDVLLAMERGEVQGRCGWTLTSLRSIRPDWLGEKKAHILVQTSLEPDPELPGIPNAMALAKDATQRQILELHFANQKADKPVFAPPAVPPERLAVLRKAFAATLEDPDFLEETRRSLLAISYVSGEELAALMQRIYATPESVAHAAQEAIKP